ncbi:esterase/lipase family protein [Nonomuraea sp. NPDC049480]|uniref:esterase/lipase family protein n=1 Tax=Nonomuraea sp. NPDC049480 TaxID=3364353 RepID=UPI0037B9CF65
MSDRVDDLVVVLPGILGSVLEHNGTAVWDHSLAAMRRVLPPRRLAAALQIDEPLQPARLINGVHLMPGLWKIDGYGSLLRYLRGSLDFSRGNLVEFPYDWRLSCADNAVRLDETVERELTRWRETVPEARVSYLCHSMGGLIARYSLEVLGGRSTARRLVTIGTPHQGAAKAAVALSLGLAPQARARLGRFGEFLDRLGEVMSEFPSVHELLPTYRCVDTGDGLHTLSDVGLPGIGAHAVRHGVAFHRKISESIQRNGLRPYTTHLFGGHLHKTVLSVRHDAAGVAPLTTWNGESPRGDGTVPRFAAVPPEEADDLAVRYSGDRHAVLASAAPTHHALHAILTARPVRAYQAPEHVLALDLPDLITMGEEAEIEVEAEDDRLVLGVFGVHDESDESWHGPRLRPLGDGRYRASAILPRTGVWRVTVKSLTRVPVEPVSDVVVVVDPAAEW